MKPAIRVCTGPTDYQRYLRFKYNAHVNAELKNHPGCLWTGSEWVVPKEVLPDIKAAFSREYNFFDDVDILPLLPVSDVSAHLWPPQQPISDFFCSEETWPGGFIDGDMGVGKSPISLDVVRRFAFTTGLIICPASVIDTWVKTISTENVDPETGECFRWNPHLNPLTVKTGKQAAALTQEDINGRVLIISYGMVKHVVLLDYQFVIADECHYLNNWKSQRTQKVHFLCRRQSRSCFRLGLSGTPIANKTQDLHGPMNALFPDRVSTYMAFARAYCQVYAKTWKTEEGTGTAPEVRGMSDEPEKQERFKRRFARFRARITFDDVAPWMPSLATEVHPLAVKDNRSLSAVGMEKAKHVVDWIVNSLESGPKHLLVSPFHINVAKYYADKLRATGLPVGLIHGEVSMPKRTKMFEALRQGEGSILVGTLKTIREGLNVFDYIDVAVLAEIPFVPNILSQWLGRFQRANRTKPCLVRMFYAKDSQEERVVSALEWKLSEIAAAIGHGGMDKRLVGLLGDTRYAREEMQAQLREVLGDAFDDDGWDILFEE